MIVPAPALASWATFVGDTVNRGFAAFHSLISYSVRGDKDTMTMRSKESLSLRALFGTACGGSLAQENFRVQAK